MSMLEAWHARRLRRALYWWQPADGRINVGDHLSKVIVEAMLALRDLELPRKRDPGRRLFAIGSVLHNARDGETVWGSGINAKIPDDRHRFRTLDVRAVRGPLTRRWLMDRGLSVPQVYGDPALLMPAFYPRELVGAAAATDFVVVPHFNEPAAKYAAYQDRLLSPATLPLAFVRTLLGAGRVVSSSLHGVILAEAYGVPAVYLDSGNGENRFKYDDYYAGTGRPSWHAGRTVEECLDLGANGRFDLHGIQQGLRETFPYDLW
ncbi:polysaccharide pyruvyl transferase family protein [Pseudoxanthomonas putridarboris]|uniref:Polysaccharide pyruvyl transferase family protein n=1 Tax=Pseudoxanthomonas putridarboris TaxID=752605 RepID=A0ABU9IWQ7_9GAMM